MSFARQIFGPSQAEVWQQLSREIGADFIKGGIWKGDKVIAKVKEWTIILDTYTVSTGKAAITYTRMRAPYVNPDGFRFKIHRQGFFDELGKMFGAQDIEVGFSRFDEAYIIKGNNEDKVRRLFLNERIRTLIDAQPNIYLEVKDDEGWFGAYFSEGVDELYFVTPGVIKDVARLKGLYDLFAEILNQLCHIGSAYENDPNLVL